MRRHSTALIDHAFRARLERDAEDVHQARVATRRLRAALRVFKKVLPPETDTLRDQLHWIASHLGATRDLDVQIRRLQARAAQLAIDEPVEPFCTWLENRREHELTSLEAALQSSRFAHLVTDLQTTHIVSEDAHTVEDFAPARLQRAWRPLRKRADKLSATSTEPEFHAVRIRAKRLRYTAEFFEPIYGKRARQLILTATDLQDLLGDLQDGVVLTQKIRSAIESGASTWPAVTSLALGELIQWEAQHALQTRREFRNVYAEVERAWGKLGRSL